LLDEEHTHASLSRIGHIGPSELQSANLLPRFKAGNNEGVAPREVILATNLTTEGEATANYMSRLLKALGICMSRTAMRMPVGSALEYIGTRSL
jgi:recombination protein RecR